MDQRAISSNRSAARSASTCATFPSRRRTWPRSIAPRRREHENKLKTVESEQKQKVAVAEAEALATKKRADGLCEPHDRAGRVLEVAARGERAEQGRAGAASHRGPARAVEQVGRRVADRDPRGGADSVPRHDREVSRTRSSPHVRRVAGRWRRPTVIWSGREDLNLRPLGPHPSTLPGCATPRSRGL